MNANHLKLERSARRRLSNGTLSTPEPIGNFHDVAAWVLIGDPGAGKTDVFGTTSIAEGGSCIPARDFMDPQWPVNSIGPVFIDGLDEISSGHAGGTALNGIRSRLLQLGTPPFRLSCREADWRGNADSAALQRLVGEDNFVELHLEPLTQSQTLALVAHWRSCSEGDAAQFIRQAEVCDLDGLLDNPQTLRMLVEAIRATNGEWPNSKTKTYEMACEQLVQEPNDEHRAAQHDSGLPVAQILDAAGYLNAVMLLSGGTAIAPPPARPGALALFDLHYGVGTPTMETCKAALRTRLFREAGVPVHRTVAEYLGARYLAACIKAGLPPSRVLALMQGEDGGIVPALRGLHAWLAAAVQGEIRRELIQGDPLGLVLNGDVRHFSRADKQQLLGALRTEATRYTHFRNQNWTSHPFGALATLDMEGDFLALLQSTDRSEPHMALLVCVLDALENGHAMTTLAPALEQMVRDSSYWPRLRTVALGILTKYPGLVATLRQLLAEVHSNVVEDLEDELLGELLDALFPTHISTQDIWHYFRQPKSSQLLGSYWIFWNDLAKDSALEQHVPELLDALTAAGFRLEGTHDHLNSAGIVGRLLVRGVIQGGAAIDINRLYNWLQLGVGNNYSSSLLRSEEKSELKKWLTDHPAMYKALFEHGLSLHHVKGVELQNTVLKQRMQLYGADEPCDAENWYLSLAAIHSDTLLRRELVRCAYDFTRQSAVSGAENAAIELLEHWIERHTGDTSWAEELLRCPYPPPIFQQEFIESEISYKVREAQQARQQIAFFRETLPSFNDALGNLGALVKVANTYLNLHRNSDEKTPRARLLALLNQDEDWVRLALHGLRRCLFRTDLPLATETIGIHLKGQRYNLAVPCLAAMELRHAEDPEAALDLPIPVLESVLAFRLTHNFYEAPQWFKRLLVQSPSLVAEPLQHFIQGQTDAKAEHIEGLYSLARDPDYAAVAAQITPQLVANFPLKASEKQRQGLRLLIVSALAHLDTSAQREIIATKLAIKGMDVAQRAYWLTAGLLVLPSAYLSPIQQFVAKNQARASHIFALLQQCKNRDGFQMDLPITTQAFLIELLGPKSNPDKTRFSRSGLVTPVMEMAERVEGHISTLAGNPDDAATQALERLQKRPDLKHWSDSFNRAVYDQRIARRKARFTPASVSQVCKTLANLEPASAQDLFALTIDNLKQLAGEIRNGSTNDYDQYWANEKPNSEGVCRNALLSDLRRILAPMNVAAEQEAHYADSTRADIKIIAPPYHFPIEIKCEWHPALWTAIGGQLIAKYGREVSSDGYGIYLVFWFSGKMMTAVPSDGGAKPKTPQELQQRLAATVPSALRNKIAVVVVDCSKPVAAAKRS